MPVFSNASVPAAFMDTTHTPAIHPSISEEPNYPTTPPPAYHNDEKAAVDCAPRCLLGRITISQPIWPHDRSLDTLPDAGSTAQPRDIETGDASRMKPPSLTWIVPAVCSTLFCWLCIIAMSVVCGKATPDWIGGLQGRGKWCTSSHFIGLAGYLGGVLVFLGLCFIAHGLGIWRKSGVVGPAFVHAFNGLSGLSIGWTMISVWSTVCKEMPISH